MIGQTVNFINLVSTGAVVGFGCLYSEPTLSTLKYLINNFLKTVFSALPGSFNTAENVALSNVYSMKSIEQVSSKFETQFVPSKFTFSIWALIYFGLSLFAVLSMICSKEDKERIGRNVGPWFFLTNILNICWMMAYSMEYIFVSHLIIVGLWWCLFNIYSRVIDVRYGFSTSKYPLWVKLPFSIYLAWVTVACVASTMMVLKHDIMKPFIDSFSNTAEKEKLFVYNLDFSSPILAVVSLVGVVTNLFNEQQWTASFITLTTVAGLWFSKFKRDSLFVLVLLWAVFGISVKHWSSHDLVYIVCQVNMVILAFEFIFSFFNVLTYPGQKLTEAIPLDLSLPSQKREAVSGVFDIEVKGPSSQKTTQQTIKKRK